MKIEYIVPASELNTTPRQRLIKRLSILFIIYLLLPGGSCLAQYYLRGEVKDDSNQPLQNVQLFFPRTLMKYATGVSGGFGITSDVLYDSVYVMLEGYQTTKLKVKTDQYLSVVLKPQAIVVIHHNRLASITRNFAPEANSNWTYADESYNLLIENDFIKSNQYPNTGFATRIDKASYSNIRRFINQQSVVPTNAVRIEEMLNYFNFNYKEPKGKDLFRIESQVSGCPWDSSHQLLFLNVNARKLNFDSVPPSNFVFLIDVSGSMDLPNRLPLLKESFQLLVRNLREKDAVSIVTYGGNVSVVLGPTPGTEKQKITKAIEQLQADGDTPGEQGLRLAYQTAMSGFKEKGNNRIILATDGDFNVGISKDKDLEDLVLKYRNLGVTLTCLGVGMGNYKDSKIEILAKRGNGNFAYLDNIKEAEKFLIKEFTQSLYSVAKDVYLNVQFMPHMVKEYRLIGYENKGEAMLDSANDLEGGEIGSGNSTTAVFEIVPEKVATDAGIAVACLELNYKPVSNKAVGNDIQRKLYYDCPNNYLAFNLINKDLRFASAVCMFGLLLRQSRYITAKAWNDIIPIAKDAMEPGDYLQNEFIEIVDKAKLIYQKGKKKKRIS